MDITEPSMERIYYALKYRLDHADAFLLFYSDEPDGVVLDEEGQVPTFRDVELLRRWAQTHRWEIQDEEPTLHDLDVIEQWSQHPSPGTVDCIAVLNAWNLS